MLDGLGDRLGPAVTCATTEHFNLQTARAATISEANGRATIYLAALSSNLIALAFFGQMSHLGPAFYAFALILHSVDHVRVAAPGLTPGPLGIGSSMDRLLDALTSRRRPAIPLRVRSR